MTVCLRALDFTLKCSYSVVLISCSKSSCNIHSTCTSKKPLFHLYCMQNIKTALSKHTQGSVAYFWCRWWRTKAYQSCHNRLNNNLCEVETYPSLSFSISQHLMQPNLYLLPNRHWEHLVIARPCVFETSGFTPVSWHAINVLYNKVPVMLRHFCAASKKTTWLERERDFFIHGASLAFDQTDF